MPERFFDRSHLRAIIFDLDGTLYRQGPVRRAMLLRLLRNYARRPLSGLRTLRVLGAYRSAQELLRQPENPCRSPATDLAEAQIRLACERTKVEAAVVAECVSRWMDQEPLAVLGRHRQPGLLDFLHACRANGLRLAILSDYPAEAKLIALGLQGMFDVVVSAQSAEVGAFKPNPRGLLVAAERLGATPTECLYVGDRAEVDGAAAVAAGMASFILTQRADPGAQPWVHIAGYWQLHQVLLGCEHS